MTSSKFGDQRQTSGKPNTPPPAKPRGSQVLHKQLILRSHDAIARIYDVYPNGCRRETGQMPGRIVRDLLDRGALESRMQDGLVIIEMTRAVQTTLDAQESKCKPQKRSEKRHDSIIERMQRNSKIFNSLRIKTAQRFLTDYERGQSGSSLTAVHRTKITMSRPSGGSPSHTAWEARDRAQRALAALPPPVAQIITELCVQEQSYSALEKERGWQQGAAAAVLGEALSCLALAYDGQAARGRARAEISAWRADLEKESQQAPETLTALKKKA